MTGPYQHPIFLGRANTPLDWRAFDIRCKHALNRPVFVYDRKKPGYGEVLRRDDLYRLGFTAAAGGGA